MIALGKTSITIEFIKTQLLLGFLLLCFNCTSPTTQFSLSGETMGTTYSMKIVTDKSFNNKKIKDSVDSILTIFNKQMSTWDPESEISTFNRWNSSDSFKVSDYFYDVVVKALSIYRVESKGMFDITVFDLLSLWGFGPNPKSGIPGKDKIDSVLRHTGSKFLNADKKSLIKNTKIRIDLNAIAKGYGVDILFNYIKSLGYKNLYVEIGGEVRFSGQNKNLDNWKIGLENPPSISTDSRRSLFCNFSRRIHRYSYFSKLQKFR